MGYGKLSVGVLLALIGVWTLLPKSIFGLGLWRDLLLLLKGSIPLLVILVGVFIVWLELEDMKYRKPKTQPAKPPEAPKPASPEQKPAQ